MADRTGRAMGTLDPVIFFENSSGHILLPPVEIGKGPEVAHMVFNQRYKAQGYIWKEAGTLSEVDRLQNRLVDQETKILSGQADKMEEARERVRRETSGNLRQRMASADCSPYERDFIQLWLDLRDGEKRKKYRQAYEQRNLYLWARENDSKTTVDDRMA